MDKSFKFLLDFIVDIKSDPSKIKSTSKQISEMLGEFAIDVNFDKKDVEKEITTFLKQLSKLDTNKLKLQIETGEASKELKDLFGSFDGLGDFEDAFKNIDYSELNNLKSKIDDLFSDFDSDKISEGLNELGNEFNKFKSKVEGQEINIGIDKNEFLKSVNTITNELDEIEKNKIEVDFDAGKAKEQFKELSNVLSNSGVEGFQEAIDNIDFSEIEKMAKSMNLDFDVDGIKKLAKEIDNVGNNTTGFKTIDDLIENLEQNVNSTDFSKFKNGIGDIDDAVKKAKNELNDMISKNKNVLSVLEATGKSGSEAYNKIEAEIKEAEAALGKLGAKQDDFQKSTKSIGDKMATFGMAYQGISAISDTFSQFIEPYKEFDVQIRNIGTLGIKNFEEFRSKAIELSTEIPESVAGITAAIYDGIGAGAISVTDDMADVDDAIQAVTAANKLAVAGVTTTSAAMQGLSAVTNAYGRDTLSMAKASDTMFGIVNYGVASVEELNASLSNVVPIAGAAGVTFDQVGGAIATMTKQGTPAAQATTKIRSAIAEIMKPGANLKKVMDEAGVSMESLKSEGLQATFKKLGETMTKMGTDSANTFSSIETISFALAVTGDNASKAQADLEDVQNATGSVDKAFKIAGAGVKGTAEAIMNDIQATAFKVFGTIGDGTVAFLDTTNKLAPAIASFAGLSTIVPDGFGAKLKGFSSTISTELGLASNKVNEFTKNFKLSNIEFSKLGSIDTYKKGISSIGGSVGGLGSKLKSVAPMLTNPYLLGAAAITLYLTQTEQGNKILDKLGESAKALFEKFKPFVELIVNVFGVVIENLSGYIMGMVDAIGVLISSVIDVYGAFFEMTGISDILSSIFGDSISSTEEFSEQLDSILKYIMLVPASIKILALAFKGFFTNLPAIAIAFFDLMKEVINPVNWFDDGDAISKAKDKFANVVSNAMDEATNEVIKTAKDLAIDDFIRFKEKDTRIKALDNLVSQFEDTKDEVAKNNIAMEIAKDMPEAVKGYKMVADANGNLIKVLDINIDKVKELNKARGSSNSADMVEKEKQIANAILLQAKSYDKVKQQSKDLSKQIIEAQKKGDTGLVNSLKKDYDKVQEQIITKSKDLKTQLDKATEMGITMKDVKIPPNFENDFTNELLKLQDIADEKEIGKKITESIQLKESIDKNGELNKLVEDYKKAGNDFEKESIAKKIAKTAPELVQATGSMVASNGQLVKTYEVATNKVNEYVASKKKSLSSELTNKQNEVLNGIKNEGKEYEALKSKIQLKNKEISEAIAKGQDTSELEKQFNTLTQKAEQSKNSIVSSMGKAKEGGIDVTKVYGDVSKSIGVSKDEVAKMTDAQNKSKDLTKEQKTETEDLAAAWSNVKSQLDDTINKQVSTLSEMRRQRAEGKLTKEQKAESLAKEKEILSTLKDNAKEQKNLEKINENVLIQAGLKEVSGKSAWELAKAEYDLKKSKTELEYADFEISQTQLVMQGKIKDEDVAQLNLLNEKNKTAKINKDNLLEVLKTKRLITGVDDKGEVVFNSKIKDVDKVDIQKLINDVNKEIISNEKSVKDIQVKVNKDSEQINKEITELNKQRIDWQISLNVPKSDILEREVDRIKSSLDIASKEALNYSNQIKVIETKILNEKNETTKVELQKELNIIKGKYLEKAKLEFDTNKQLLEATNNFYEEKARIASEQIQKAKDGVNNEFDIAISELEKYNTKLNELNSNKENEEADNKLSKIDKNQEKELKKLEDWQGMQLLSTSEFEKKKTQIEKEAEEERAKIREGLRKNEELRQNVYDGEQLQLQNQKAILLAEIDKKGADEQLNIVAEKYKSMGKVIDFDTIKKAQLEIIEAEKKLEQNKYDTKAQLQKENADKIIKENIKLLDEGSRKSVLESSKLWASAQKTTEEKADLLKTSMDMFNGSMLKGIEGMFEGDPEAMKDNMRSFMQNIAGFLKKQLEATILQLVLSKGVLAQVNLLPFPANTLALGAITLAIKAAVNAIANPVISSLTSFATGGRIDQPTLAVIGDGAKLGSNNKEWIFRDEQLKKTINMANNQSNREVVAELKYLREAFHTLKLETTLRGEDIYISNKKVSNRINRRQM